jgi:hypothetical protein
LRKLSVKSPNDTPKLWQKGAGPLSAVMGCNRESVVLCCNP